MSWIGDFDQEQRLKRKRVTKLSMMSRYKIPITSDRDRSLLPRIRKRLRTLTPLKDASDVTGETDNVGITLDRGNKEIRTQKEESLVRANRARNSDDDMKIHIDHPTLKMIELEVQNILPTSLFHLASTLAEAENVLYFHSQNKRYQHKSSDKNFYYSSDTIFRSQNSSSNEKSLTFSRRKKAAQNRLKKRSPSVRVLAHVFSNLGILREADADDYDSSFTIQSPELELKEKFSDLAHQVGSFGTEIKALNAAKKALETILVFPTEKDKQDGKQGNFIRYMRESKRTIKRGLDQYRKFITRNATKKGLLKPGEKWKQIQIIDTSVAPVSDELEKQLDQAKLKRHDQISSDKAKDMLDKKALEREEEIQKRLKAAEEAAKKILRPLTTSERDIVEECIYGQGPGHEIIASSDTDSVQRDSMRKLQPRTWLNDEVIHYFLLMLAKRDEELCNKKVKDKRCHFFKSFFITKLMDENGYKYSNVKRWSKRVPGKDIFNLDKIVFPVNISGMHWSLIVIFMQEKKIQFFDSMGGSGKRYLDGLMQYLKDEHVDKKKCPLEGADKWKLVACQPDTPQQENGTYDLTGIILILFRFP